MTQEEKQLLLKDLCARLPYEVKISFLNGTTPWTLTGMFESEYSGTMLIMLPPNPPKHSSPKTTNSPMKDYKPYLRPMSSMTEEEKEEYVNARSDWYDDLITYDWLNEHHFDYRGLLERGLALEAPEGMY